MSYASAGVAVAGGWPAVSARRVGGFAGWALACLRGGDVAGAEVGDRARGQARRKSSGIPVIAVFAVVTGLRALWRAPVRRAPRIKIRPAGWPNAVSVPWAQPSVWAQPGRRENNEDAGLRRAGVDSQVVLMSLLLPLAVSPLAAL
jgi:hypothetical protein